MSPTQPTTGPPTTGLLVNPVPERFDAQGGSLALVLLSSGRR
jgi:hypothetical protein